MLKLKLQYFGHQTQRAVSLEKTLMLGKDEMVGWHHRLNGHEFGKLWEMVKDRESWPAAAHGITKSQM